MPRMAPDGWDQASGQLVASRATLSPAQPKVPLLTYKSQDGQAVP
jgi:hypothetical protein